MRKSKALKRMRKIEELNDKRCQRPAFGITVANGDWSHIEHIRNHFCQILTPNNHPICTLTVEGYYKIHGWDKYCRIHWAEYKHYMRCDPNQPEYQELK